MRIAFVLIFLILAVWRIKTGFNNGIVKEIVNIISAVVACVCIVLIFFVISSVKAQTYSMLTVCAAALIGIGILFKLCNLIFKPIEAIVNISIISSLDKLLGAVFGLAEAVIFAFCLYFILIYAGIVIY